MATVMYTVKHTELEKMRVSREQMAKHREEILEAAARLFRERGFDAVTVREVMEAAGLTHGGFYGHFASKDELIAKTLEHVLDRVAPTERDLGRYAEAYLNDSHCRNLAEGCPTAALGAETVRQGPEARAAMTASIRRQVEHFSPSAAGASAAEQRRVAIASWSAMVGALVLARLSDDPALSKEILSSTRGFLSDAAGRKRRA
jgi:TetR/AcrR family transcriptional regulator, transcriptional repressor for nem operon